MFCEMVTSHRIESINHWKAVTPASHLLIGELYTPLIRRELGIAFQEGQVHSRSGVAARS